MKNILIPDSISLKMAILKKKSLKGINAICDYCKLDDKESNLVKRYISDFLSFKKRGNISDLPIILELSKKKSFRYEMESAGVDYPFFRWVAWDMVSIANFYAEFTSSEPWGLSNYRTWTQLNSQNNFISYSGLSLLYAYIISRKPSKVEMEKHDYIRVNQDLREITENPIKDFYKEVKDVEKENKIRTLGNDFYEFAQIVLLFFPEEKESLYSINLPFDNDLRNRVIEDAFAWVERRKKEINRDFSIKNTLIEKLVKRSGLIPVPMDVPRALKDSSPIQVGEEFQDRKRALWMMNESGRYKVPITETAYTRVRDLMSIIAGGASGLEPIGESEDGSKKYKTSIYKLWKIATGRNQEPNKRDINSFIMGLEAARIPIVIPYYYEHPKKGKRRYNISITLCSIEYMLLPNSLDDENLGSQTITIEPSSFFYGGKISAKEHLIDSQDAEDISNLSIDINKKVLVFAPTSSYENSSDEWSRFRDNILSSTHRTEADLMESVFNYSGQLSKARAKDEAGIKYTGTGKFKNWEEYTRRHIQKHKSNDRQTLLKMFERAEKKEGLISEFTLTNSGVYKWEIKNKR